MLVQTSVNCLCFFLVNQVMLTVQQTARLLVWRKNKRVLPLVPINSKVSGSGNLTILRIISYLFSTVQSYIISFTTFPFQLRLGLYLTIICFTSMSKFVKSVSSVT